MFMEQTVKPIFSVFTGAMLKVCPGLDAADAMLCVQSVVAQLKQVICAREMFPDVDSSEIGLDDMTEVIKHIVTFSAVGIRHYAEQGK